MAETTVKTPSEWRADLWGTYSPGINDFMSVIQKSLDSGDVKNAQLAEAGRNSYVSSNTYTGTERTTNIVGNFLASQATNIGSAAEKVVEKITEPAKDAADQSAEKQTETKVIYSSFDPSGYATITPEVASETGGKILGYGIIAVIGLVILDKLFA